MVELRFLGEQRIHIAATAIDEHQLAPTSAGATNRENP